MTCKQFQQPDPHLRVDARTPPLDSRFRWNDEMSGGSLSRIGVRDMLS